MPTFSELKKMFVGKTPNVMPPDFYTYIIAFAKKNGLSRNDVEERLSTVDMRAIELDYEGEGDVDDWLDNNPLTLKALKYLVGL